MHGPDDHLSRNQFEQVLAEADRLHNETDVDLAFDRLAKSVTESLSDSNPLVLAVMLGGLIPAGRLLKRLSFPLETDYLHATRYRGETSGGELHWCARPSTPLKDRVVLVVDDILDEGLTLAAILDDCRASGAKEVYSAVLVEKQHDRKPKLEHADFMGLAVVDRYVFGCGMDYKGYFRNLPAIYAVKGL